MDDVRMFAGAKEVSTNRNRDYTIFYTKNPNKMFVTSLTFDNIQAVNRSYFASLCSFWAAVLIED